MKSCGMYSHALQNKGSPTTAFLYLQLTKLTWKNLCFTEKIH